MEIEIRLFTALQKSRAIPSQDYFNKMEVPSGITVDKLLKKMHIHKEFPKMILLNGIEAEQEELLKEGDVVSVFN